eukprot:TRINITY_DN22161_c0_g1_i1.p1 TRINITY_DN22161_c0_g1~~TRINITY_DN22161_c0_g1_i1.p1  ORF type:complete len:838 (+),score=197.89 TRINITY_DN22161_c0_g1_i1:138-2516(+)
MQRCSTKGCSGTLLARAGEIVTCNRCHKRSEFRRLPTPSRTLINNDLLLEANNLFMAFTGAAEVPVRVLLNHFQDPEKGTFPSEIKQLLQQENNIISRDTWMNWFLSSVNPLQLLYDMKSVMCKSPLISGYRCDSRSTSSVGSDDFIKKEVTIPIATSISVPLYEDLPQLYGFDTPSRVELFPELAIVPKYGIGFNPPEKPVDSFHHLVSATQNGNSNPPVSHHIPRSTDEPTLVGNITHDDNNGYSNYQYRGGGEKSISRSGTPTYPPPPPPATGAVVFDGKTVKQEYPQTRYQSNDNRLLDMNQFTGPVDLHNLEVHAPPSNAIVPKSSDVADLPDEPDCVVSIPVIESRSQLELFGSERFDAASQQSTIDKDGIGSGGVDIVDKVTKQTRSSSSSTSKGIEPEAVSQIASLSELMVTTTRGRSGSQEATTQIDQTGDITSRVSTSTTTPCNSHSAHKTTNITIPDNEPVGNLLIANNLPNTLNDTISEKVKEPPVTPMVGAYGSSFSSSSHKSDVNIKQPTQPTQSATSITTISTLSQPSNTSNGKRITLHNASNSDFRNLTAHQESQSPQNDKQTPEFMYAADYIQKYGSRLEPVNNTTTPPTLSTPKGFVEQYREYMSEKIDDNRGPEPSESGRPFVYAEDFINQYEGSRHSNMKKDACDDNKVFQQSDERRVYQRPELPPPVTTSQVLRAREDAEVEVVQQNDKDRVKLFALRRDSTDAAIGLHLSPDMVIEGVTSNSPASRHVDIPNVIGWRVTHVAGQPVNSPEDISIAIQGIIAILIRVEQLF